jgi:hypothetical protein
MYDDNASEADCKRVKMAAAQAIVQAASSGLCGNDC